MAIYECTWVQKDAFLQGLRDLLKPAILADGYDLHAEDAGKQVFVRGPRGITQKAGFHVFDPPPEEILKAMGLTVGYVLTPTETRVRFQWDNPYCVGYRRLKNWLSQKAHTEATRFYEYLEDWYRAARLELDGSKDRATDSEG